MNEDDKEPVSPANLTALRNQLTQLDEEELFFLQITALLDGRIPREELFRIMKALYQAPGSRRRWHHEEAAARLRRLRRLELVDNHNRCHPEIREIVARRRLDGKTIELCRQLIRSSFLDHRENRAAPDEELCARTLRNFRLALLAHDFEALQEFLPVFHKAPYDPRYRHPYAALTLYPFDPEWFGRLPLPLQFAALDDCITHALEDLVATPELDRFILAAYPASQPGNRPFILLYAHKLLLSGRLAELEELYRSHGELFSGSGFDGAIAVLKGDFGRAAAAFRRDLALARTLNPEGRACFDAPIAFFYILTLGHTQTEGVWIEASETLDTGEQELAYNPYTRDLFRLARCLLLIFQGFIVEARQAFAELEPRPARSIFSLLAALVEYWLTGRIEEENRGRLACLAENFSRDFPWPARESATLLALDRKPETAAETVFEPEPGPGPQPLSPAISFEPAWRRTLTAIKLLKAESPAPDDAPAPAPNQRLAWFIEPADGLVNLTPRIQKRVEKGWSAGRNLALSRIYEGERLPFFTEQDEQIFRCLRRRPDSKGESYSFDLTQALPALVDHPHLFRQGEPQTPVVVSPAEVAVIIAGRPGENSFTMRLAPDLGERELLVVEKSPTRLLFYRNREELREVSRLLGPRGLSLPQEAEEELRQALAPLAGITPVYTDLGPEAASAGPARLYLQIFPTGSGLHFDLKVKPLGDSGPLLLPGEGPRHIFSRRAGTELAVSRDLEQEQENLEKLRRACPGLRLTSDTARERESLGCQVDDLESCLEILGEIQLLLEEQERTGEVWLTCEWPAGRQLRLKNPKKTASFHLTVTSHEEWFKLDGGLRINEREVVELAELLQNIERGPGGFVPLKNNQFVALTRDLRQRLHELSFYLNEEEGELRIHKSALGAVAEILEGVPEIDYGREWKNHLQRLAEAEKFTPELPEDLKTELRGYQREGFDWLARLAHLGFGACLADDMGLGKTVQTLALILSRAAAGPVLVVAPTSVCDNWIRECERFAPRLCPIPFGGTRRKELIAGLKPYDLVVCSYTMLQQERELLGDREWEIIVLDEAQAIKNMNTKRSRAAMSLKGAFRLITTGTPMENHLGELWNLFNFINPGLLGTLEQFNRRFALPIEQEKNAEAREHLRRLIKPFILRRRKDQVLKELPPRTEILLKVELSEAERSFYEAVRRQAIARLEEASRENDPAAGNTSIQVLAELTRLRLAACNPRLVAPESQLSSAKLELFGRIVNDLISGGHRALVFSQFVKHLNLIREYLDEQKISYRYLDGSTPKTRRQAEINTFQEGETPLFLISLKAGGLGLNLTAADYVLHLDPWWNPAVEDQASDRAHRIGQTRAVTVYRLISRHTIEEKIVRLHLEKRNLADQILTASDQSARFSTAELLELIKEGS